MATVIQIPDSVSLLRNLKEFVIGSSEEIAFTLSSSDGMVLSETYYPDPSNRISVDVRDVVSHFIETQVPYRDVFVQTKAMAAFTAFVDGSMIASFTVINGGVRKPATSASEFLRANWMTWQPQTKHVRWRQPEFLTYYFQEPASVKAKFYKLDGSSRIVSIADGSAGTVVSFNTTMSFLFGKSGMDISELYGMVDVWTENSSGTQLSYVQRYINEPDDLDGHIYLCVNSLGGVDTFNFHGSRMLAPDVEHSVAEASGKKLNITDDAERSWIQNTGYLGKTAFVWLWELLASSNQWAVIDGATEPIVITDSSPEMNDRENLNAATFTYKLSEEGRLLNISRSSRLPDVEIPTPSGDLFFLNLRLLDYPDATLEDTILFLVQSPFSGEWAKTSLGAIKNWILQFTMESSIGRDSHTHPNKEIIDKFGKNTGENVNWSGNELAYKDQHIRKDIEDVALELIKFLKGSEFGEYEQGLMFGRGAKIDENGNAEFESVSVRSYLHVMELIVNRLAAIEGDQLLTEGDTITGVTDLGDGTYRLQLQEKWDGYFTAQAVGNVLKGIFNTLSSGHGETSPGSGQYYTAWMRVLSVNTANNTIEVIPYPDDQVPSGKNYLPAEMMKVARWGNAVDETRQSCLYLSSTEGRIVKLAHVTKPIIDETNYGFVLGEMPEFVKDSGLPIQEGQDYVYIRGVVTQDILRMDYRGKALVTYVDRGIWDENPAEPYHCEALNKTTGVFETSDVWYMGCKWRALVDEPDEAPKWNSTQWAQVEGNPAFEIELESSRGDYFDFDDFRTVLTVTGKIYNLDVTSDIRDEDVQWTRYSEDAAGNRRTASDNIWASRRAGSGKTLSLTQEDVDFDGISLPKVLRFTATATLRDGATSQASFEYS